MTYSYTNIRRILDEVMKHPLLQDITLETAITYTINFFNIVGIPTMFQEEIIKIPIHSYLGELPCNIVNINQIRIKNKKGIYQYFRGSTYSFQESDKASPNQIVDLTYKIQNNIICTSIEEGDLEISANIIPTDDDGYPMIPDNSNFIVTLQAYIKKEWFTILFDLGKITQASLQNAQQEYAFKVGQCETEFLKLSVDEAESFYNSFSTLLSRKREHATGFRTNGNKEYLKIQ